MENHQGDGDADTVKKSIQWMSFDSEAKEISSGYFASMLAIDKA